MAWHWTNTPNLFWIPNNYGNSLGDYPEGHPYYVWNSDEEVHITFNSVPDTYILRDWKGTFIRTGTCSLDFNLGILPVGHYRLYFYKTGANDPDCGDAGGSMHIAIWRRKTGMPDKPTIIGDSHVLAMLDATTLRLDGIGSLDSVDSDIENALEQKAMMEDGYLNYPDAARPDKNVVVHFTNGTTEPGWAAAVKKVVDAFGTEDVWYECRNEPDNGTHAEDFVAEMQQFYNYVKAANPNARVLGPNQVSINGGSLDWTRAFLENGGGNYLDGFSFHGYNACSGELARGRKNADKLTALLKEYNQDSKPLWMTEWGCFASTYGSYTPMRQLRWIMLELLLWEQYNVPKEHFYYFYERSHGFWDYPSFITTDTRGYYPAATAMRVFSGEVLGKAFAARLDFGDEDNDFIGSRYSGSGDDVVVLMASGRHGDEVTFLVGGAVSTLEIVDAVGASTTQSVTDGKLTIAIPGAPVYIHLPVGVTFVPVTKNLGPNLAQLGMWSVANSSTGNTGAVGLTKELIPGDYPYWQDAPLPITITVKLGQMTSFDTVYIRGTQPWQVRSAILEGYVEVKEDSNWVRIGTMSNSYTNVDYKDGWRDTCCFIETYYDERFSWCFTADHIFRSDEVRLVVTKSSWGGEFAEVYASTTDEIGQGVNYECLSLQGIEVYRVNKSANGSSSSDSDGSNSEGRPVIVRKT